MEQRCWKQNRAHEGDVKLNPSSLLLGKEREGVASLVSLRAWLIFTVSVLHEAATSCTATSCRPQWLPSAIWQHQVLTEA